jgi:cyclase
MMQKVTDNVYVEGELSVCNTSIVVTKEGVVVIDTPMVPANAKKVAAEIARFGPVRYVINSEPHTDHIAGNCYFGGTVVAHEGTRQAILALKAEDLKGMLQFAAPGSPSPDKDFRFRPPEITLSERLTLYLGDHTFHLTNMPGHSPHQVAVYVPEERVVFTSDNIIVGLPFFRQALPDKWLQTLKELEKLDVNVVVPGHGSVCKKSYIKEMYKIVKTWIDTVAAAVARGMSSEEVQDKVTMYEQFPQLPHDERTVGVIRMNVARIYETLKKRK